MEWSIQDIARLAGTTSRTLRHYGQIGLLAPSRVAANGYRYYDQDALVRLQQILVLRGLGLGLPAIGEALDGQRDTTAVLRRHLRLLEAERGRLDRRIASVRTTLRKLEGGEQLMPEEVLDGFDHTRYEEEVVERWGRDAYDRADRWWRSLTAEQKAEHQQRHLDIARDYGLAHAAGKPVDGPDVTAIVARHVDWLSAFRPATREYVIGLGEMYVADPRFGANYDRHGTGTVEYVRDAMRSYAERVMTE